MGFVLSADRKWLAWWTAGQQIDVGSHRGIVEIANIPGKESPAVEGSKTSGLVFPNSVATELVAFDNGIVVETGGFNTECQTARARE